MNSREAVWFARVIRLVGVKELFAVLIFFFNWLLAYRGSVIIEAQRQGHPHSDLFWASLSLVIGVVLLRFAPQTASALIGRRGPRKISNTLSAGTSAWLSIGVRSMAFLALPQAVKYLVGGFFASITEYRAAGDLLGHESFHYFVWGFLYGTVGIAFSMRPDIIGIFVPAEEGGTRGPASRGGPSSTPISDGSGRKADAGPSAAPHF